jgi:CRP-like cAMP-binding protein
MSSKHGDFTPVTGPPANRGDPAESVERTPALRDSPLMQALGAARARVLRLAIARRHPDKVGVFEHGDTGGSLFFVLSGGARLFGKKDTRLLEVDSVGPGGFFGETEVLEGTALRRVSAVARGPLEALEIARELLHEGGALSPAVMRVLKVVADGRAQALARLE